MGLDGTVFIVDDDPLVRHSLKRLLRSVDQPCEAFSTAEEFLEGYDPAKPGCLLLDVRMPGIDGIELHQRLVTEGKEIPVVLVTGHGDIPMAAEAMRRGAVDFMTKPADPQQLLDRIRLSLARDAERRRAKEERDANADRLSRLTPREREVVDLVVTGMNNRQIATRLGVSSQTIDAHRARAMAKLDVNSVAGLVRFLLTAEAG